MTAAGWSKVTSEEAEAMYADVRAEVLREIADGGKAAQATDFFQPCHTYQRGRWQFHCLAVAARPWSGETRAIGYLSRDDGTGTVTDLGQTEWAYAGWIETAQGGHLPAGEAADPAVTA